jgi:outer membrane biosynthesis protein TonB
VQVHFYIDEKGVVRMPAVQNGPHPYLMEMAVEAMKGWKFEPPTSRGRPVLVAAAQTFEFGGGNR